MCVSVLWLAAVLALSPPCVLHTFSFGELLYARCLLCASRQLVRGPTMTACTGATVVGCGVVWGECRGYDLTDC